MGSVIAYIAELESRCRAGFTLDGQIPFLIHLRVDLRRPNIHDRTGEGIAWDCAARTRLGLVTGGAVDRGNFRWGKRRVASETKIGARSFQVRGDGVCAT